MCFIVQARVATGDWAGLGQLRLTRLSSTADRQLARIRRQRPLRDRRPRAGGGSRSSSRCSWSRAGVPLAGNQLARGFAVAVVGISAIEMMFFLPAILGAGYHRRRCGRAVRAVRLRQPRKPGRLLTPRVRNAGDRKSRSEPTRNRECRYKPSNRGSVPGFTTPDHATPAGFLVRRYSGRSASQPQPRRPAL